MAKAPKTDTNVADLTPKVAYVVLDASVDAAAVRALIKGVTLNRNEILSFAFDEAGDGEMPKVLKFELKAGKPRGKRPVDATPAA
jgi:hypothetical protein